MDIDSDSTCLFLQDSELDLDVVELVTSLLTNVKVDQSVSINRDVPLQLMKAL